MIKFINNMWSIVKMTVVLLFMVIVMSFVETDKLIEVSLILMGFYVGFKSIDLLYLYLKNKIQGVEKVTSNKTTKPQKPEINPEIKYVEGLIDEIKNKVKKTVKDKNTLDLLNIKLKQLKNV